MPKIIILNTFRYFYLAINQNINIKLVRSYLLKLDLSFCKQERDDELLLCFVGRGSLISLKTNKDSLALSN